MIKGVDDKILDQAAEWMMRCSEGQLTEEEQFSLQQWKARSTEHEKAWQQAELLMGKFKHVPSHIAVPTLLGSALSRREMVRKLAIMLAILPPAWATYSLNQQQRWTADYRSPVGQRQDIQLSDGTRLVLNSDTAIDVIYDEQRRLIRLLKGEIWIETAKDSQQRPFFVETIHGTAQALGTRFMVKQRGTHTLVAVTEGTVRVQLKAGSPNAYMVNANQQICFSATASNVLHALDSSVLAWRQGMLVVDALPLPDFIVKLEPYHHRVISLAEDAKTVRISGAYPVDHMDQVLSMLSDTYHLQVDERLNGYWINIKKKS